MYIHKFHFGGGYCTISDNAKQYFLWLILLGMQYDVECSSSFRTFCVSYDTSSYGPTCKACLYLITGVVIWGYGVQNSGCENLLAPSAIIVAAVFSDRLGEHLGYVQLQV